MLVDSTFCFYLVEEMSLRFIGTLGYFAQTTSELFVSSLNFWILNKLDDCSIVILIRKSVNLEIHFRQLKSLIDI